MFCHVTPKQVLGVHNVSSTYHVPLLLREQGLGDFLSKRLNLGELDIRPRDEEEGRRASRSMEGPDSGGERALADERSKG